MSQFTDKNFLVIGASSGIGHVLATKLKEQGANLYTASRNKPEGIDSHHFTLDVSDISGEELKDLPDVLHGLAYCPGTINLKPFQSFQAKDFLHDFQINALGAARVLQMAMKSLRKSKGASVVLYSTVAVQTGINFHSSIAMAKGAVEGLTRSLAAEWSGAFIRVNAIAPSLTDTPLAKNLLSSEDKRKLSEKRHPIAKVGSPEDMAEMSLFLLSDKAAWISGQVFGVDGGLSSLRPL